MAPFEGALQGETTDDFYEDDDSLGLEPAEEWKTLADKLEFGKNREPVFGPLVLNAKASRMGSSESGKTVVLTPQEFQILWLLVRAGGNPVSVREIEEFLYRDLPDNVDRPLSNGIPVQITNIRKKLATLTDAVFIPSSMAEGVAGKGIYSIELKH